MVFLPVPWYSIYSASINLECLADVVLRHAAFVATAAAAARSIQALLRRREVTQFESACLVVRGDEAARHEANERPDNDSDDADAVLRPPANFAVHLSACARDVFRVPALRPR